MLDAIVTRLEALVAQLWGLQPTQLSAGTPASQLSSTTSIMVVATTVNAVASGAIDTGYAPPNGHMAGIDGKYTLTDRTNHVSHSGNVGGTIQKYAGTTTVPGSVFGGANGSAALNGAVPSFGVSGTGTLTVTFTPPLGYVGTVEWEFRLNMSEN